MSSWSTTRPNRPQARRATPATDGAVRTHRTARTGPAPAPKAAAGNGAPAKAAQAPQGRGRPGEGRAGQGRGTARQATQPPAAKTDEHRRTQGREAKPPTPAAEGDEAQVLRGAAAAVVKNMSASLDVPTATSVRAIPAKLMIDNRIVINNHLKRTRGGKISLHPPARLRDRAGGQEVPEHEPPLRRGRRQAERHHPRAHQPGAGDRPAGQGRQPSAGGGGHQGLPRRCGSASSSPPTRTSCGAPATAS